MHICREKSHLNFVKRGMRIFDRIGHDFSEEQCTLWVDACIRLDSAFIATKYLGYYSYRISAWLTPGTFQRLLDQYDEKENNMDLMIKCLQMTTLKGFKPRLESMKILANKTKQKFNVEGYNALLEIVQKVYTEEQVAEFQKECPQVLSFEDYCLTPKGKKLVKKLAYRKERQRKYVEAQKPVWAAKKAAARGLKADTESESAVESEGEAASSSAEGASDEAAAAAGGEGEAAAGGEAKA